MSCCGLFVLTVLALTAVTSAHNYIEAPRTRNVGGAETTRTPCEQTAGTPIEHWAGEIINVKWTVGHQPSEYVCCFPSISLQCECTTRGAEVVATELLRC